MFAVFLFELGVKRESMRAKIWILILFITMSDLFRKIVKIEKNIYKILKKNIVGRREALKLEWEYYHVL